MISHKKDFVFVHPGRTGGSCIELTLSVYSDEPITYKYRYGVSTFKYKHDKLPDMIRNDLITEDEYDSFYKFCTVRNPWERAISYYFWRLITNRDEYSLRLIEKNKGYLTFDKKTFMDIYSDERYKHIPLVEYLVDKNGKFDIDIFDKIIRYENLEQDYKEVCKDLDIPYVKLMKCIPEDKIITHYHYVKYYDEELIEFIEDIYEKDIETFNYEYGD